MKLCLVAHGYPPELVGGTEKSVQGLARALARAGHEVVVVAGSIAHEEGFRTSEAADADPASGAPVRVLRIHRADLYFDHWQKSASARAAEAFRAILRAERPDVVHVHHWIRLTRDLVACAAREGIPAVVTLHDLWATCLISFRVRPDTKAFCEATLGPDPCLDCAAQVPPRTPWMSLEALHMAFAERRMDLVRELALARAVVVPSRSHAALVGRFLGLTGDTLAVRVVPIGHDMDLRPRAPLPPPGPPGPPENGEPLVLGAWGHLHPLKGPDLLLDALALLPEPRGVVLRLAGGDADPAFGAELRRRAPALGAEVHGPFPEGALDAHPVSRVHAMVSGTRAQETWGLVVDEALALRLPMLLPRAGAFPERLREGEGVLFYEQGDARALADAMRRLRDEPALLAELRAALPPLRPAVSTVAEHAERLLAVYREALAAGAPPAPTSDWWARSLRQRAEEEWDRSLAQRSAEELGFA